MRTSLAVALFLIAAHAVSTPLAAKSVSKKRVAAVERAPERRGTPYAGREEAQQFAADVTQRRDLPPGFAERALAEARMLPVVARLMQPPPAGTPKNWRVYRSRFIDPVRIGAGVRFWQDNRAVLEKAEQEFGVPAEIVVGIIGVETIYGQQMGDFRVIDALATLAFDFPQNHPRAAERSQYFRGELEHFLAWHAARGTDPLKPRGSYAGAMGMPQFMPSSLAKWGVDYDGDSRIDLTRSPADVIGSVANYFKGYGWQPGQPTHFTVGFDKDRLDLETLLAPDILPTFGAAAFEARGAVLPPDAQNYAGKLALVELQNGGEAPSYVAGTENFYVITRYNWSSYYAMAVIELGREVKQAMAKGVQ
jgi:membrane-bound lytic murein transglycosylase B